MNEPVLTAPNPAGTGRPVITDEQFNIWLEEMRPFLRQGSSLHYSMEKAGILTHEWSIREKYRSADWFSRKVDALRATVGELINNVGFRVVEKLHSRLVETDGKAEISPVEKDIWKTMAEKHRSAQPFFVTRTENAEADDSKLGKIIESLDQGTDYDNVAREAEKQVVAANPPV